MLPILAIRLMYASIVVTKMTAKEKISGVDSIDQVKDSSHYTWEYRNNLQELTKIPNKM